MTSQFLNMRIQLIVSPEGRIYWFYVRSAASAEIPCKRSNSKRAHQIVLNFGGYLEGGERINPIVFHGGPTNKMAAGGHFVPKTINCS